MSDRDSKPERCPNRECGGDNLRLEYPEDLGGGYIVGGRIVCNDCRLKGPMAETVDEIYRLWNHCLPRAAEPAGVARGEL